MRVSLGVPPQDRSRLVVGKRGLYGAMSDVACPDYEGAAGKSEHVQEQVRPRLRARGGKPEPRGDVDGPLGRREVLLAFEERDGRVRHRKSPLTDRNAAGALTFPRGGVVTGVSAPGRQLPFRPALAIIAVAGPPRSALRRSRVMGMGLPDNRP